MPHLKRNFDVNSISELTVTRLSIYLRCVEELEQLGIETISSQALAKRYHLNSAQIRKDLAYFGEFGVRGMGYNVSALRQYLIEILGLSRERRIVIVGAGNLGIALGHYSRFTGENFLVVGILDADTSKIGESTPSGLLVESVARLPEIVHQREAEIGVITTPGESAQRVCDQMVEAGLRAILSFAPVQISAPEGVLLRSVDLRVHLEELSFYLTHGIPRHG